MLPARALLCLLLVLSPALAQDASGPRFDGTFESVDAQGGPAGWQWPDSPNVTLAEEDGNRFLRVAPRVPNRAMWPSGRVDLAPAWKHLDVRVRMRVRGLQVGEQAWQNARVSLRWIDAAGETVGYAAVESSEDIPWTELARTVPIPEGKGVVAVLAEPGLFGPAGEVDFDDLTITGLAAPPPPPAKDAAPPQALRWDEEPVVELSATRGEKVLNGLWRFAPAPSGETPPAAGWGYARVPGDWRTPWNRPGVAARGEGPGWGDLNSLARAWYERTVTVPESWRGRAVLLRLDRVSTDAQVWVIKADGEARPAGGVDWPYGEVDITGLAAPGETVTLRLLVVATADEGEVLRFMGPGEVYTEPAGLASRGLIGDVVLASRPFGAHVSDIFVQPSVRRGEVTLDIELIGVEQAGPVTLTARMLDEAGEAERTFTAELPAAAAPVQTLRATWPWADARRWDLGRPELYTAQVEVSAPGLRDVYPQPFGFREFWIDGRDFYLNGTKVRLRPSILMEETSINGTVELIDAALDGYVAAGFNLVEPWPWDHDERGSIHYRERWAERADRKGFALAAPSMSASRYFRGPGYTWIWDEAQRAKWESRMRLDQRRYRNHPSVLLWASTPNTFGHGDDQNPYLIGRKQEAWLTGNSGWQRSAALAEELASIVKRHDPTRPVLFHQGGPTGDVYALNMYLNIAPLQEREEWLSAWAADGTLPFGSVEFGTPLYVTFHRGRAGYGTSSASEPLLTEFSALYFGRRAYEQEDPAYRREIVARFEGDQTYRTWHGHPLIVRSRNFQDFQALFNTHTWRSWRTWGVSFGMVPWDAPGMDPRRDEWGPLQTRMPAFEPGRRGTWQPSAPAPLLGFLRPDGYRLQEGADALFANNQPTLAWIAGPGDDWPAKDHHFRPGDRIAKSIVLINDSRTAQEATFTWEATVAGRRVDGGQGAQRLDVGEIVRLPIAFTAPAAAGDADGAVTLTARFGDAEHRDTFAFRVLPTPAPAPLTVAALDPAGETTAWLRALGHTVLPWDGNGSVPGAALLVIGREALSASADAASAMAAVEAHVAGGGRALLMAQDPDWMSARLGLRVAPHLARRAFAVDPAHPVMAGLDESDLRDWTGHSALVEPRPRVVYGEGVKGAHGMPYYVWHWGNRGAVSSAMVEKPHHGAWRPLLEGEWDLAYSPLLELDHGRGRLTLCTLDLEDHVPADPAAARLAANVVRHAAEAPLAPRASAVVYVGDDAGAGLLDRLGVQYRRARTLEPGADLAIVGGEGPGDDVLRAHLERGGRLLLLARQGERGPLDVTLRREDAFAGSLAPPAWPEAAGLSASDLRWRAEHSAWRVAAGAEVGADGLLGRVSQGPGVAIVCQIDPDRFGADERTYFRYTRWRQTRALSQVLANLGATFAPDARVFDPQPELARLPLQGGWRAKLTREVLPAPDPQTTTPDAGISDAARALVGETVDETGWLVGPAEGPWESFGTLLTEKDGEVVARREVMVPAEWAGRDLTLSLGAVDDFDITFFNGVEVGRTGAETPQWWGVKRVYPVPGRLVKPGRNVIAVRIYDHFGGGGLYGQQPDMGLAPTTDATVRPYHPDYRADFAMGDDPYRYYRW